MGRRNFLKGAFDDLVAFEYDIGAFVRMGGGGMLGSNFGGGGEPRGFLVPRGSEFGDDNGEVADEVVFLSKDSLGTSEDSVGASKVVVEVCVLLSTAIVSDGEVEGV